MAARPPLWFLPQHLPERSAGVFILLASLYIPLSLSILSSGIVSNTCCSPGTLLRVVWESVQQKKKHWIFMKSLHMCDKANACCIWGAQLCVGLLHAYGGGVCGAPFMSSPINTHSYWFIKHLCVSRFITSDTAHYSWFTKRETVQMWEWACSACGSRSVPEMTQGLLSSLSIS